MAKKVNLEEKYNFYNAISLSRKQTRILMRIIETIGFDNYIISFIENDDAPDRYDVDLKLKKLAYVKNCPDDYETQLETYNIIINGFGFKEGELE